MAVVDLLLPFVTGQLDPLGVDDNHVVASVQMRGPGRFSLASEQGGHMGRQTPQDHVLSVYEVPSSLELSCLG